MGKICLKGLKFHAYHGVYEEEQKHGNTFIVDLSIKTNISKSALSDKLEDTIDYVMVNNIVKEEMKTPSKLLENVVYRINSSLASKIKKAKIRTTIYKMNPPLGGDCEYSSVTLKTKS